MTVESILFSFAKDGREVCPTMAKSELKPEIVEEAKQKIMETLEVLDADTVINLFMLTHSALLAEMEEKKFNGSGGYEL